jgi:hypothetical protein
MAARAPGWFEAVKSPNGWTYTLNPADRQPSPWPAWTRWLLGATTIALIVIGGGLLWSSVATPSGSAGPAGWYRDAVEALKWCVATPSGSAWDGNWVVGGLAGLVCLGGGVGLAIDQLRRRASRCELRLDAGAIRAIWRLGPFSWSKTVRRSDAAQLAVVRKGHTLDASPIGGKPGDYHVLVVEDETGQRRKLVANYPRDMLLALAVELSSRWKAPDIDPDVDGVGAGKLAVIEDTEVPTDIRERLNRPLGSGLICERVGDRGVRFTKPPDGLASTPGCVMSMIGILLAPLIVAVILSFSLALYRNGADPLARILTFVGIGVGVLWCVFVLVVAFGMSTARFVLTATPDCLTLETHNVLRGTSCRTWTKQDIAWIRADTTIKGTESGTVVTTRVLIRTSSPIEPEPDELRWGLGIEIHKPELEWIATTLRAVLGVPATDPSTGPAIQAG